MCLLLKKWTFKLSVGENVSGSWSGSWNFELFTSS